MVRETVETLVVAAFLALGARGLAGDFVLSGDADPVLAGTVGVVTGLTGAVVDGRGESVGRRLAIGSSFEYQP
jgi:hypothetical protein